MNLLKKSIMSFLGLGIVDLAVPRELKCLVPTIAERKSLRLKEYSASERT